MIHTDGKRTIADNTIRRPTAEQRVDEARALREKALDKAFGKPGSVTKIELDPEVAAELQWNDDRCACGGEIADSPAGDKCWHCFNYEPEGD
jgi:hypothetical protein